MNAIDLKSILLRNLETVFVLSGQLAKSCTFFKTVSNATTGLLTMAAIDVPATAIFVFYQSSDIDGSAVLLGDEKCFVRVADLVTITTPGVGDNLTENVSGIRRNVIAARLDPTGSFWTMQVRRAGGEDWGELTAATSDEDYGDLSPTPLFDDLQN